MDIKNLNRATSIKNELADLDKALQTFDVFDKKSLGFVLTANKDLSGGCIEKQYLDGNYHPMYVDILDYVEKRFKKAKDDLIIEIQNL